MDRHVWALSQTPAALIVANALGVEYTDGFCRSPRDDVRMLNQIRRFRDSYAAKVVLVAIALSFFIGFGVLSSTTKDPTNNNTIVARVDGKPIFRRELDEAVQNLRERYRQQFGAQLDENIFKQLNIEQIALQNIISREAFLNEAKKAGLVVTDEEVRDTILKQDAFKDEKGNFDQQRYVDLLRASDRRFTPAEYESLIRQQILLDRLQDLIDRSILLTDDQLREVYVARNEKANVRYVAIGAEEVAPTVRLTEADLQAYYDAHKAEYALPEERQFKFLDISPGSFALGQSVSDEDLRAEYEKRKNDFKQDEEVRAAHVLFKVAGDDEKAWAEARKKAEEIVRRARAGEDFASLAKAKSEDTSASTGGDLGFFGRGRMVKPFEDTAFALKPGEISDPVRTQFGYHVIKVLERREAGYKPFEQVRLLLERDLRVRKGAEAMQKAEGDIAKQLEAGKDLEEVAKAFGLEVQNLPFVKKNGPLPGLLDTQNLLEAGFALQVGQTSKLVDVNGAKGAVKLLAIRPARQRELAEVRAEVEKALRLERAGILAASRAQEILEVARKSNSLAKAAGPLPVKETGEFAQVQGEVPGIGKDPELLTNIFALHDGRRYPDRVFKVGEKYYVLELKSRTRADLGAFEAHRHEIADELAQAKRQALMQAWLQNARSKAQIEVYLKSERAPSLAGVNAALPVKN